MLTIAEIFLLQLFPCLLSRGPNIIQDVHGRCNPLWFQLLKPKINLFFRVWVNIILFKGIICLNFQVEFKENGECYWSNAKAFQFWNSTSSLRSLEGLQLLRHNIRFFKQWNLKKKKGLFSGSICAAVELFRLRFSRVFQPQADIQCVKFQSKLLMIGKAKSNWQQGVVIGSVRRF